MTETSSRNTDLGREPLAPPPETGTGRSRGLLSPTGSARARGAFVWGLTLREAIFLSFLGAAIAFYKLADRLALHLPGHSGIIWMSFMVLGRLSTGKAPSATFVGTVAGLLAALTGQGKEGPFVFIKYFFPGLTLDFLYLVQRALSVSLSGRAVCGGHQLHRRGPLNPNSVVTDVEPGIAEEVSSSYPSAGKSTLRIPGLRLARLLTTGAFSGIAHLTKLGGSYLAGVLLDVPRNFLVLGLGYSAVTHFIFGVIGGIIGDLVYARLTRTGLFPKMFEQ